MNILDILNIPFGYVIEFCYKFIPNYAITLLLFAVFVKILLFPLGIKQQKNMVKQASLRPKEMAIRARYAGRTDKVTQQKQQEDIMALYKTENYSPFSGCLPILVQFPILIALYNVIRNPLTYLCHMTTAQVTAVTSRIQELFGATVSQIDAIKYLRTGALDAFLPKDIDFTNMPDFSVFGGALNLGDTPSISNVGWLLIIPIVTFIAVFASMKLTRKLSYQPPTAPGTPDAANSMKIMDYTMPLFSVWITFTVPAIVGLYWIYQNLLGVLQQFVMVKLFPYPKFTEEEIKAVEREMNGKIKKDKPARSGGSDDPDHPRPRSLHHIDDDEYNRPAQPQPEKPAAQPAQISDSADRPVLKEDRPAGDRKAAETTKKKRSGGIFGKAAEAEAEKDEKPRSLHHIDDN